MCREHGVLNVYLASESTQVRNPVWTSYCYHFIFVFFLFSCLETIYRKVAFVFPFLGSKKSSGALKHLFQSIALELTVSHRLVKEKPRRLSMNRIAKEEPIVFSLQ